MFLMQDMQDKHSPGCSVSLSPSTPESVENSFQDADVTENEHDTRTEEMTCSKWTRTQI